MTELVAVNEALAASSIALMGGIILLVHVVFQATIESIVRVARRWWKG